MDQTTEPTYPIFDADGPICYDCQVLWPCATVAEMQVAS